MRLLTAHKILITAAAILAMLLVARSAMLYAKGHGPGELITVGVGLVLTAILGAYLRSLLRR